MAARSAARQPLPVRPWHHRRRVYLRRCVSIRRRFRGFAGPTLSFLRRHSSPGDGSPSSPERTGECPYRPLRGEGTPPTSPLCSKILSSSCCGREKVSGAAFLLLLVALCRNWKCCGLLPLMDFLGIWWPFGWNHPQNLSPSLEDSQRSRR